MYLKFMPKILDWISIRTFGGCPPPVDPVVLKKLSSMAGCVLGVVILHKPMSIGIHLLTERN